LLLQLNRESAALDVYETLMDRNPENKDYYIKMAQALGLSDTSDVNDRVQFYKDIHVKYPRALLPRRLPLNFTTGKKLFFPVVKFSPNSVFHAAGQKFEELVDQYLRSALRKGIPPLFVDLKHLYKQPEKAQVIEKLVLGYCEHLAKTGCYDASGMFLISLIEFEINIQLFFFQVILGVSRRQPFYGRTITCLSITIITATWRKPFISSTLR
jgi:peptide alpha-N-acetyltransferase